MVKGFAIAGLVINLFGVVLLFRYGMPYRVETKGAQALLLEEDDLNAISAEGIYRRLGCLGFFLIVAGTALQIWSVTIA